MPSFSWDSAGVAAVILVAGRRLVLRPAARFGSGSDVTTDPTHWEVWEGELRLARLAAIDADFGPCRDGVLWYRLVSLLDERATRFPSLGAAPAWDPPRGLAAVA
jgi:hypothetical protein